MGSQEVKYIKLEELILWTENPRDPIDPNSDNSKVISTAIVDKEKRWKLKSLAKKMGSIYDYSEIPIVVYHGEKPIVYDGNRRMVLAMLQQNLFSQPNQVNFALPEVANEMPCNICDKKTALLHIYRKHGGSGSWRPLEQDIFLYEHMNELKSPFMVLDEATNIISNNPDLNQGFVKDELLHENGLKALGFNTENQVLNSKHSEEEAFSILNDIVEKVSSKEVSTRNNRGRLVATLDVSTRDLIKSNASKPIKKFSSKTKTKAKITSPKKKKAQRQKTNNMFFGKTLYLKIGDVNDLYRDIDALYNYHSDPKNVTSDSFIALIRMSLRLICETAAKEEGFPSIDGYINKNFDKAKLKLSKDQKTSLSASNVNKNSLNQLLQIGGHNYTAAKDFSAAIAISIIIGEMLEITHGRKN